MTSRPVLRLAVLGQVLVEVDPDGSATPVALTGKPLALLVHLACQRDEVSRDRAAALFWPGSTQGGKHSLRQALSQLRSALPEGLLPAREELRLPAERVVVDIEQLSGISSADDAGRLISMVRGTFCRGLDFSHSQELEEWFAGFAADVALRVRAATRRVAEALIAAGRADEARDLLRHVGQMGVPVADLRSALFGQLDTVPSAATALQGSGALVSAVNGTSVSSRLRVTFVGGARDSVRGIVRTSGRVTAGDVAVCIVPGGSLVPLAEGLRRLLQVLAELPGGSERSVATARFSERLAIEPAEAVVDGVARNALADAFDSVLERTPLVVLIDLEEASAPLVELVARSLSTTGGRGILVVAHARDETLLVSPFASSLAGRAESVVRIALPSPVAASGAGVERETDLGHRPGAAPRPAGIRRVGWIAALAAVVIVSVGIGRFMGGGGEDVDGRPSASFVLCSSVDGTRRLYLDEGGLGVVERVSSVLLPTCQQQGAWMTAAGRLFVAASGGHGLDEPVGTPVVDQGLFPLLWFRPRANLREDWDHGLLELGPEVEVRGMDVADGGAGRFLSLCLRDLETGLYRIVVVDGATLEVVTVAEGLVDPPDPYWNSAGDHLFWRETRADGALELRTSPWPQIDSRRLAALRDGSRIVDVMGDSLLVRAVGDATTSFLLVPTDGQGPPVPLTSEAGDVSGGRLSPDGRRLCWESSGSGASFVRVLDRRSGTIEQIESPHRLERCVWSLDGAGFHYEEVESGERRLFFRDLRADQPVLLHGMRSGEYAFIAEVPAELGRLVTPGSQD